jgi:hypothetical protein
MDKPSITEYAKGIVVPNVHFCDANLLAAAIALGAEIRLNVKVNDSPTELEDAQIIRNIKMVSELKAFCLKNKIGVPSIEIDDVHRVIEIEPTLWLPPSEEFEQKAPFNIEDLKAIFHSEHRIAAILAALMLALKGENLDLRDILYEAFLLQDVLGVFYPIKSTAKRLTRVPLESPKIISDSLPRVHTEPPRNQPEFDLFSRANVVSPFQRNLMIPSPLPFRDALLAGLPQGGSAAGAPVPQENQDSDSDGNHEDSDLEHDDTEENDQGFQRQGRPGKNNRVKKDHTKRIRDFTYFYQVGQKQQRSLSDIFKLYTNRVLEVHDLYANADKCKGTENHAKYIAWRDHMKKIMGPLFPQWEAVYPL